MWKPRHFFSCLIKEINGENETLGQGVPDSKDSAYEPSTYCASRSTDSPELGSSDFNVMMLIWDKFVFLMRAEFIFFPRAFGFLQDIYPQGIGSRPPGYMGPQGHWMVSCLHISHAHLHIDYLRHTWHNAYISRHTCNVV